MTNPDYNPTARNLAENEIISAGVDIKPSEKLGDSPRDIERLRDVIPGLVEVPENFIDPFRETRKQVYATIGEHLPSSDQVKARLKEAINIAKQIFPSTIGESLEKACLASAIFTGNVMMASHSAMAASSSTPGASSTEILNDMGLTGHQIVKNIEPGWIEWAYEQISSGVATTGEEMLILLVLAVIGSVYACATATGDHFLDEVFLKQGPKFVVSAEALRILCALLPDLQIPLTDSHIDFNAPGLGMTSTIAIISALYLMIRHRLTH